MFFRIDFFALLLVASALTSVSFGAPLNDILSLVLRKHLNDTKNLEARAPTHFNHPGVLLGHTELEYIKSKVKAREEPWSKSFMALKNSEFAQLNHKVAARANVNCGFYDKPAYGCFDERHDALSAYAASLLWYVTGKKEYAQKAISYMNGWAKTLKTHSGANAGIQAGWAATSWTRAAEIIRYTNAGWASKDIKAFEKMLQNVYLPRVIKGSTTYNGNWDLGKHAIPALLLAIFDI